MGRNRATVTQTLSLIDEYEEATGDKSGDLVAAAKWLFANNKVRLPKSDPVKIIARMLARASGQDYFVNEQNEPVRRRLAHPVPGPDGEKQQGVFAWFKIDKATPEQMKMSASWRRNGTLTEILQLVRDMDYYNTHYNPGEPISVNPDFTEDVAEARMPAEYPDEPPAADQPEE